MTQICAPQYSCKEIFSNLHGRLTEFVKNKFKLRSLISLLKLQNSVDQGEVIL